ncbi:MAG TPA: hypothetical protein VEG24_08190 [Gaiellaceae bacterium]|nr:hypothetical protein [Gaiellaceae bacterium]
MSEPVAEIRYSGDIHVRPYRRGTYLGDDLLEALIEETLGDRYRFGEGWHGTAVVSIQLHERPAGATSLPSDTVAS